MPELKCRNCCVRRERTHQFPSAQLSLQQQQQQGGWSVHEALMKNPGMFWRGRVHVLRSYPLQTHLVLGCRCLEVHLWKLNPFEQCQENSESLFTVNNVRFKKSGSLPVLWWLCLSSPLEPQDCASVCDLGPWHSWFQGQPHKQILGVVTSFSCSLVLKQPPSAYATQALPVTTAYSRSCLKIKSKEFALLSFL